MPGKEITAHVDEEIAAAGFPVAETLAVIVANKRSVLIDDFAQRKSPDVASSDYLDQRFDMRGIEPIVFVEKAQVIAFCEIGARAIDSVSVVPPAPVLYGSLMASTLSRCWIS